MKYDLGGLPGHFLRALDRLHETHPDLTVQQLRYLFFVAENPGLSIADVYRALGSNTSIASRTFAILSDIGTPSTEGLDLVEMRQDDKDRRLRRLFLTPKGLGFLSDLCGDLGFKQKARDLR